MTVASLAALKGKYRCGQYQAGTKTGGLTEALGARDALSRPRALR